MPVNFAPFLSPFPEPDDGGIAPAIRAVRQERLARGQMAQQAALAREQMANQRGIAAQRAQAMAERQDQEEINRRIAEYRNALAVGDLARRTVIRQHLGGLGKWDVQQDKPPAMEPFFAAPPPILPPWEGEKPAVTPPVGDTREIPDAEAPWRQYGLAAGGGPGAVVGNADGAAERLADKELGRTAIAGDQRIMRDYEKENAEARAAHEAEQMARQAEHAERADSPTETFRDKFGREFTFDHGAIKEARKSDMGAIANIYMSHGFSEEAAAEGAAVYARTGDARLAAQAVRSRQARIDARANRVEDRDIALGARETAREDAQAHDRWKTGVLEAGRDRRAERAALRSAERFAATANRAVFNQVKAIADKVAEVHGVKAAYRELAAADEMVAKAQSKDSLTQRAAVGALLRGISGAQVGDKERDFYMNSTGLTDQIIRGFKNFADGGKLPDNYIENLVRLGDVSKALAQKRIDNAAVNAGESIFGAGIEFRSDEQRRDGADWGFNYLANRKQKKPRQKNPPQGGSVSRATSVSAGGVDATERARSLLGGD